MMIRSFLAAALVLILNGCDANAVSGDDPIFPIQTDKERYEMTRRTSDRGAEGAATMIVSVFTNLTPDTVYLGGCLRPHAPQLLKQVDGEWVAAYNPSGPLCGLTFWPVAPRSTYTDTVRFNAWYPGQGTGPEFTSVVAGPSDIPGRYRLRGLMYTAPDRRNPPLLDEEFSVSNEFELAWPPGEAF